MNLQNTLETVKKLNEFKKTNKEFTLTELKNYLRSIHSGLFTLLRGLKLIIFTFARSNPHLKNKNLCLYSLWAIKAMLSDVSIERVSPIHPLTFVHSDS